MYNVFLNVKGDETLVFRGNFKEVNQYEDSLRDRIRAMDLFPFQFGFSRSVPETDKSGS